MYLELSRPRGDVSRWSKVYKRLQLLNKHYPVGCPTSPSKKIITESYLTPELRSDVERLLIKENVILLGMDAVLLHLKDKSNKWSLPLDILAPTGEFSDVIDAFAKLFEKQGKVKLDEYPAYAELLPKHVDISDEDSGTLLVRVFETMACHSYHELKDGIKVASIPTLLQFFFAFLYADAHFLEGYDENRIICTAQRLVEIAHEAKGARRFQILTPLDCLGKQEGLFDMREHASKLKAKTPKDSPEFLRFFFTYQPTQFTKTQKQSLKSRIRKALTRKGDRSSSESGHDSR